MQKMEATQSTVTSGTTSVKLGRERKDTLSNLAKRKKRTVHSLLIEAVDLYTKEQTAWAEFEDQAIRSYENYRATGLHVTHEELTQWAESLQTNPNAQMPVCHK